MSSTNHFSKFIEERPWESGFFGFSVSKVDLGDQNLNTNTLKHIIDCNLEHNYTLCMLHTDTDPAPVLETLTYDQDLYFIEKRITFKKDLQSHLHIDLNIQEPDETSIYPLFSIALLAGQNSRFKKDRNFPNELFEDMYRTWVRKSVTHTFDDVVFSYRNRLHTCGFASARFSDNDVVIGLIGVSSSSQGKGIATKLLNSIENSGIKRKCKSLLITTQSENTGAIAFYKRYGLVEFQTSYVTHIWFKPPLHGNQDESI